MLLGWQHCKHNLLLNRVPELVGSCPALENPVINVVLIQVAINAIIRVIVIIVILVLIVIRVMIVIMVRLVGCNFLLPKLSRLACLCSRFRHPAAN